MSNCIDCACKQIETGYNSCGSLHEMNDSVVSGSAKVFQFAQICDYPKLLPKAFYAIWCMFKNVIAQLCWLTTKVRDIEIKLNLMAQLLEDLKGSGAWIQTGDTIFDGHLAPDRHLATGNINVFGGTPDGSHFIRTNSGSTEDDLAGGI